MIFIILTLFSSLCFGSFPGGHYQFIDEDGVTLDFKTKPIENQETKELLSNFYSKKKNGDVISLYYLFPTLYTFSLIGFHRNQDGENFCLIDIYSEFDEDFQCLKLNKVNENEWSVREMTPEGMYSGNLYYKGLY